MLKINFFSDAFYPDWTGGLQRYATELAMAALSRGHHVVLWTREWGPNGLDDVSALLGEAPIHNVFGRIPAYLRGPALAGAALFRLGLGRPSGNCSVFHTSVLGAAFMKRKPAHPQVYVFHASAGHELLVEAASKGKIPISRKLKAACLMRLERRCLQLADVVVVLSEFSQDLLGRLHPELFPLNVVVIPGGTNVPRTDSNSTIIPRSRRIVVLRRLEWRMGIDILLRAFATSRAREMGWRVDIVGTGSQADSLRMLSEELDLSESVVFHGRVTEERKNELLDSATLSVLPTRALEGFGLATVEAMARGIVPIVTTAGASPEIVGKLDRRLICEPTEASMSSAIDYWAVEQSEHELSELGDACRIHAQEYAWTAVLDAYEELINQQLQTSYRGQLK